MYDKYREYRTVAYGPLLEEWYYKLIYSSTDLIVSAYSNFVFVQIYGFLSVIKSYAVDDVTPPPTGDFEKLNGIKGAVDYYPGGTLDADVFSQGENSGFTNSLQNLLDEYTEDLGNDVSGQVMQVSIKKLRDLGEFI